MIPRETERKTLAKIVVLPVHPCQVLIGTFTPLRCTPIFITLASSGPAAIRAQPRRHRLRRG